MDSKKSYLQMQRKHALCCTTTNFVGEEESTVNFGIRWEKLVNRRRTNIKQVHEHKEPKVKPVRGKQMFHLPPP